MSDQTQAQFDAEVAEYAAMGIDPAAEIAEMLTPPASDLDRFTTAELEQQAGLYYRDGMRLMDTLPAATWTESYRVAYAAAREQLGLMRAVHVELARRTAEGRAHA